MCNSKNISVVLREFEQLLQLKYSGRTPANYLYHVKLFLDYSNNVPLRVNNEDILNYNVSIRNKSNSFRNVAINAIKSYFKLYLRKQVKGFSSIRPPKEYKKPKVYDCYALSEKIQNIGNKKHKAILALSLCCWLRKSELLNIKISDINGSLMTLKINQSKGCKDRVVIISENTINILREYYKEYKPKEYLFEGLNGGKYSSTSVDKLTKKYLYKDMRFHSLRASGATFALSNGTDLKTVSEILGHKHIQTTEYYIPILYKTIKQAI